MARAFSLAFGPAIGGGAWMRRWFRWRRVLSVGLGVFLLGMVGLGLAARARSREAPAWWSPPSGDAAAAAAERTEQGLVNEAHRVRGGEGDWTIELDEGAVNAWLAVRLPEWMASQDPPLRLGADGGVIQVLFRPGLMVAAWQTGADGERRVISVGLTAAVDASGRLVLTARSASLGRLGLPLGWVLRAAEAGVESKWKDAVRRGEFSADRPDLRLADGRRVRVLGVELLDGALRIRCRTRGMSEPEAPR